MIIRKIKRKVLVEKTGNSDMPDFKDNYSTLGRRMSFPFVQNPNAFYFAVEVESNYCSLFLDMGHLISVTYRNNDRVSLMMPNDMVLSLDVALSNVDDTYGMQECICGSDTISIHSIDENYDIIETCILYISHVDYNLQTSVDIAESYAPTGIVSDRYIRDIHSNCSMVYKLIPDSLHFIS